MCIVRSSVAALAVAVGILIFCWFIGIELSSTSACIIAPISYSFLYFGFSNDRQFRKNVERTIRFAVLFGGSFFVVLLVMAVPLCKVTKTFSANDLPANKIGDFCIAGAVIALLLSLVGSLALILWQLFHCTVWICRVRWKNSNEEIDQCQ